MPAVARTVVDEVADAQRRDVRDRAHQPVRDQCRKPRVRPVPPQLGAVGEPDAVPLRRGEDPVGLREAGAEGLLHYQPAHAGRRRSLDEGG